MRDLPDVAATAARLAAQAGEYNTQLLRTRSELEAVRHEKKQLQRHFETGRLRIRELEEEKLCLAQQVQALTLENKKLRLMRSRNLPTPTESPAAHVKTREAQAKRESARSKIREQLKGFELLSRGSKYWRDIWDGSTVFDNGASLRELAGNCTSTVEATNLRNARWELSFIDLACDGTPQHTEEVIIQTIEPMPDAIKHETDAPQLANSSSVQS